MIRITRSQRSVSFPARFMLVGASNPCPCGHLGDGQRPCSCPHPTVQRYKAKLSGPLVDRIDMIVRVESPTREELMGDETARESPGTRARVIAARDRQIERLSGTPARCNGDLGPAHLRLLCPLEAAARKALFAAHERLRLSVRGHDRVLRVARTIADLDGRDVISRSDVAEAVAYREQGPADVFAAVV
jgi:magnesium chelatase family protein